MDKQQAKMMVMQSLGWTEEQFNEQEQWARQNCNCGNCPTYRQEAMPWAFCWPTIGKNEAITEEKNCVCGQCPVFNQAGLHFAYYCTRDSEVAQRTEIGEEAAA